MFQQDAKQGASQSLNLGERFVDQYYSGFNKCGKYYQPTSKVMWNGNGYSGEQFKTTVLPDLQRQLSGFEVTGFDCHALGDGPTLVTVSGFVTVDRKERFSQTFIIERTGGLTYIQSDCFRIV